MNCSRVKNSGRQYFARPVPFPCGTGLFALQNTLSAIWHRPFSFGVPYPQELRPTVTKSLYKSDALRSDEPAMGPTTELSVIQTSRSPAYYLGKLVKHIREGTLERRIARKFRDLRWARLDRWWERQRRKAEFIDTNVEQGVRLRLYFDNVIDKDIYCHDHEIAERAFLRVFLRPGDVFVDIGANLGLYSILASQLVGADGSVFSFEPDPRSHERLLHNLGVNGCANVRAYQLALSNVDESRVMQVSSGGYDAYNSFGTPVRGESTFAPVEVDCVSFDSFASNHPRLSNTTMMKVDVEGWETMVLHGAEAQLSGDTAPILQVEFNDQAAKAVGQPCSELYLWLQKLGYSIYTFDAKHMKLVPHPYAEHYVYDNVFAIKCLDMVTDRIKKAIQ